MTFTRRNFLKLLGLGGAGWALGLRSGADTRPASTLRSGAGTRPASTLRSGAGTRPAPTLRLLAAERSVLSPAIAEFTNATGAAVELDLASGGGIAGYDLAIIPAHNLARLIGRGLVRELDPAPLVFPLEQRAYDPLNAFTLPAARGVIGVNSRGVTPPASWAEFFDLARTTPAYLPPAETFNAALKSLGRSINTRDSAARARAQALVSSLDSVPLTQARLAVGAPRPGWALMLPAEGVELWEDCFCVPADSAQPGLAHEFIRVSLAVCPPTAVAVTDALFEMLSPFAPQA